ncbi:hypothetical protein KP509_21G023700 [Ceratopteris richardii]|uniref:Wall-associated receptor kinase galacturonan-binding domain-containing protein n=1 Tax=Ceratopteris richardii TaxID=49495 RepID=A0A8T2S8E7_CERRI|nr:hypothetical protein KP509_21G023700 [Ceratopteris richardii]
MHVPAMAELAFIVALLILASSSGTRAWVCEPSCGGIALNYPFGSTWGCGHANFQSYINCSHGKLNFYTPTGIYKVQSIDYSRNVIVIVDPHMSTCSSMQLSGAFGLPVGAPFTFASYNNIVLIGCSSTSSLFSKQSCDSSAEAQDICSSLYQNCDAIGQIGIIASNNGYGGQGSQSSCCVYSSSLLQTAPYEVDLPLLQCSTYTSIYGMGSIQSPQTSWLYGIALQYDPSFSSPQSIPYGQYPSCYVCQRAEGKVHSLSWRENLSTIKQQSRLRIHLDPTCR